MDSSCDHSGHHSTTAETRCPFNNDGIGLPSFDFCSAMVDCCGVIHRPSTPLLRNIICHVQKGDIINQLRVSWRFESQKMSVGDPLRNQATSGNNGSIRVMGSPTSMFVLRFRRRQQVHCRFAIIVYSLFLFSPVKDAPFLWKRGKHKSQF
jgi:hypothetical protein